MKGVFDELQKRGLTRCASENIIVLRAGKKKYHLVKVVE